MEDTFIAFYLQGSYSAPVTYGNPAVPIQSVRALVEAADSCEYHLLIECHAIALTNDTWWVTYWQTRRNWRDTAGTICIAAGESKLYVIRFDQPPEGLGFPLNNTPSNN